MYVFLIGVLMGLANLIPGVSGGTIALLGGIYNRFVSVIADFTDFKIRKTDVFFMMKIVIGIAVGLLAFSRLMEFSLEKFPSFTYGLFGGLVLGGLPVLRWRVTGWNRSTAISFVAGISLVLMMTFFEFVFVQQAGVIVLEHSIGKFAYDVLAGFLGAAAMVLPGLSGAFVMLIIGEYQRAIIALNEFDVAVLIFIGVGVIVGISFIARLLKYLLKNRENQTFSFLFGLMMGSLPGLVFKNGAETNWINATTGLLIGTLLSISLSKIESRFSD